MLHLGEALDVFSEGLIRLLYERVEIANRPRAFVASLENSNEVIAQFIPRQDGVLREVHQPGAHVWLKRQREPVGQHLLISSCSGDGGGVHAEKLLGVEFSILLVRKTWPKRLWPGHPA